MMIQIKIHLTIILLTTKVLSILKILIFCIEENIQINVKIMIIIEEELELVMTQQEKDYIALGKDHLNDQTYHLDTITTDLIIINIIIIIITINNETINNRIIPCNKISK